MNKTNELPFQNDVINQMLANGWLLGKPEGYNRQLALYGRDLLDFVQATQDTQWQKFCTIYPHNPEQHFLERVAAQLDKVDPNAAAKEMRTFCTLGVLRHELRHRGTRFSLCQFKPEHDLNPDTLARYQQNRLRIVPELIYSPWATTTRSLSEVEGNAEGKSKRWRIDLVLFVNGLPVATLELKSEFKQSVENAIRQYQTTRFAIDPETRKLEPLLTFKRGALVHFAVSQYEVYMSTRLEGKDTFFLPFNKGTHDGGAGNDVPPDVDRYATDYLWNEVLLPDNLLNILGRFVHLQIEEREDWEGRKYKKETLIFPRYHQWDVVTRLISTARAEGAGHKYLIQHSAGSGKSNSIAWCAHQLSALYDAAGNKCFHSVIVITDRTVLDAQLQDTIYQFEHQDGVVGRINNKEGDGSKSEKLAQALEHAQPIIIVTIQTFPFVLKAIENSVSLKQRNYAIIADEAHSSQTGATARQLKEVLRYKLAFDAYVQKQGYADIHALVAFSGEVNFSANDPDSSLLLGEKYTETNMNPGLKGRDLRLAFDTSDYQVMLVANKFQTGFDQPKLCAMYVDKKLGGVECVQTLSRLNRTFPGKAQSGTFVLDFFNDPQDILDAFQPYYQTAELEDVSDPDRVFDLSDKLRAAGIFHWHEVEQFFTAYFIKNKSNAAIANICKPAVERWQKRYRSAVDAYKLALDIAERTKKSGDQVLIANADNSLKACKAEKDALEIFKKDLGTFVRFYEFMSQIVDYDDRDLEKLSLYARNLRPLLRDILLEEDEIDLNNVELSHYRLTRLKQQDLQLKEDAAEYKIRPGTDAGSAKAKSREEAFLSAIIARLNEVFVTDNLSDTDMVNYAYTVRDKVRENGLVMRQLANNSAEQAMLGDFSQAVDDAIIGSSEAHQNQMLQLLESPEKTRQFARLIFELLQAGQTPSA